MAFSEDHVNAALEHLAIASRSAPGSEGERQDTAVAQVEATLAVAAAVRELRQAVIDHG
jgi:hypothetical protein